MNIPCQKLSSHGRRTAMANAYHEVRKCSKESIHLDFAEVHADISKEFIFHHMEGNSARPSPPRLIYYTSFNNAIASGMPQIIALWNNVGLCVYAHVYNNVVGKQSFNNARDLGMPQII
jgi:hypothetical protein